MTNNDNYKEFKLDNGLHVALQKTNTKTISGVLQINHGVINESKEERGITHFLEHILMTGGSNKYTNKEVEDIRESFGSFGAKTGLTKMIFPFGILPEDTTLLFDYVSDIVFNPTFNKLRIEQERERVLREISLKKSKPDFKDSQNYKETLYGKNSPHAYFRMGDKKIIESISDKDFKQFHKKGFNVNNMRVILVGDLPSNIEEIIDDSFGYFKTQNNRKIAIPRNTQLPNKSIIHTYAPDLLNKDDINNSTAQIHMSLFGPTQTDKDCYTTSMLALILGGNSNSRLFKSVSQKKGLAYSIRARHNSMENKGVFSIYAGVHAIKHDEAVDAIFTEMKIMQDTLITNDHLNLIKKKFKYEFAKTLDTNAGYINIITNKLETGITVEYIFNKINNTTAKEIQEAAIKYLPKNRDDGKYVLMIRDPLKK